jgi:hypothetical protein
METIEYNAKIKGKSCNLMVDCRSLTPEYVQIASVRDKFTNQLQSLPNNILKNIELILIDIANVEKTAKLEALMDSNR